MDTRTRLIQVADAEELAALLRVNRQFFARWIPSRPDDYFTAEGQRAEIVGALRAHDDGTSLPHVILDGTRIIGRISLASIQGNGLSSCTLGYSLAEAERGRGHAGAAVAEMCALAFRVLGLHRVDAATITANLASQRVLERNEFVQLGVAPRYVMIAGRWRDAVLYQRLSDG